jgi:hypothetical protein
VLSSVTPRSAASDFIMWWWRVEDLANRRESGVVVNRP